MSATATKPKGKSAVVTQAVDAKRRARRAESLEFYRASVFAEANGAAAPAGDVDEVVALMEVLALPIDGFATDVEAAKLDATFVKSLEGSDAKLAELIAVTEPIPAQIQKLREQIAELEKQERVANHAMQSVYRLRQQAQHLRNCHPRLFHADVDTALAAKPAAFDARAIFTQRRD